MDGKILWQKDFGTLDSGYFMVPSAQWGFGSSPVLHEGVVYLQCDVQKGSFLAALRASDGKEVWRTPRGDVPTWSTPTLAQADGRLLVLVNGFRHMGAYDAKTGQEVWKLSGGGDIPTPTPVVEDGVVFLTNAHGRMSPIYAVKLSAKGDVSLQGEATSSEHVLWAKHREGAYMPTPIVKNGLLYVFRDHGVLSCYDAKTGERIYNERLGTGRTGFTASGILADGKLLYTSELGEVFVVKEGRKFELVGTNQLGEVCLATPAASEGSLYFRTQGHVAAIGQRR
jgi:outer membrane protein assembly factor BamB